MATKGTLHILIFGKVNNPLNFFKVLAIIALSLNDF
jgi:hypothetical protein